MSNIWLLLLQVLQLEWESTSIVYTISPFITSRVHDQLRVDVAYRKAPLIICSVGAGFSYDSLGFTHFGIEDLGLIGSFAKFSSFHHANRQM